MKQKTQTLNYKITADPETDEQTRSEAELEIHNLINSVSIHNNKMIREAQITTRKGNRFTMRSKVTEDEVTKAVTLELLFHILPKV